MEGGVGVEVRRNCAAEHSSSPGAPGSWLLRGNVAKRASEEAGRRDLSGDKANNDGPWRSTQSFLAAKSCFMRQRCPRRRTKLNLGSREPLDDHHRGSALGAEPKITGVLGAWRVLLSVLCPVEQLEAKRQESGAPPVSQEAEVSDAYEAVRKQVQQEAT